MFHKYYAVLSFIIKLWQINIVIIKIAKYDYIDASIVHNGGVS